MKKFIKEKYKIIAQYLLSKYKEIKRKELEEHRISMIILLIFSSILFSYLFRKEFYIVFSPNIIIYIMLIPFACILLALKIIASKKIELGEFLTIFSIVLAILFFSFQNALKQIEEENKITIKQIEEKEKEKNELNIIQGVNIYNCLMASSTLSDIKTRGSASYQLSYYIIDVYENNLELLPKFYGDKAIGFINMFALMKESNSLINIIQNLDTQAVLVLSDLEKVNTITEVMDMRKDDIVTRAETIKEFFCPTK